MYLQWKEVDWWPTQEIVQFYAPRSFKQHYPATRVNVQCRGQMTLSHSKLHGLTKNRNTMMVLVGATPGGLVSYVSEADGGSASDRQMVERSCLPEMMTLGDEVMADKGFNCNDLFIPY